MSGPVRGPIVPEPDIGKVAQATFLILPEPSTLYRRRADRLRKLAEDSPLGEYLRFVATIAAIQHDVAVSLPAALAPADAQIDACIAAKRPIHSVSDGPRPAAWQRGLDDILHRLHGVAAPPPVVAALVRLTSASADERDTLADGLAAGTVAPADLAATVFVAAALQVQWSHLAAGLPAGRLVPVQPGWCCPVCGALPLASMIDSPGAPPRMRYLSCPICDCRWNYTRAICAACGEGKSVAYHGIEGVGGAAQAETCDECGSYVKHLSCGKDPGVDPLADDLASAGLDIMVEDAGWQRNAPNPFLLTGAS